ncbi:MAG: phenylalanine--tRNA ligase subunit alpha, partial [Victivallaceae bacterium]
MKCQLVEQIEVAVSEGVAKLAAAANLGELENLRIEYLGRKGVLTAFGKSMGGAAPEDRRSVGEAFNTGKMRFQDEFDAANTRLTAQAESNGEKIDVTLPGRRSFMGHKHPICKMVDESVGIFRRLGFIVAEGHEIEDVWHNFDALNTPADHPSRDVGDTFYFADGRLLRTQTSSVQIRVMENQEPPIRIVAPGRCFRRDTPDATHSMNFHQIEGLYIDKNVSMADLKSLLQHFANEMFGKGVKIRLRPHFFPFTEPSVEYDFSCIMCGGKGCPVCKNSGYIEIAGAGMVDPNVLKNVGYDPEIWSGFAFGMGIERLAMLKYRINDIRFLYENDIRFLEQ